MADTSPHHSSKTLTLLVARDGLNFCVSTEEKVLHFYEKTFADPQRPEDLYKEIKLYFSHTLNQNLLAAIAQVRVFYANALYTLVPQPYFNEDKLSDYLKYNVKLLPTDELAFDELPNLNANLVYVPYTNINNYLFDQFGEFTYQHAVYVFLKHTLKCKSDTTNSTTQVFVNVYNTHFDTCVFQNDKLLLCNSYNYFSAEDFVYYLLFVFEQLKLDTEKLELQLFGAITEDMKTYKLLYKYVRNISFATKEYTYKIEDAELKKAPIHQYQLLLNAMVCA